MGVSRPLKCYFQFHIKLLILSSFFCTLVVAETSQLFDKRRSRHFRMAFCVTVFSFHRRNDGLEACAFFAFLEFLSKVVPERSRRRIAAAMMANLVEVNVF